MQKWSSASYALLNNFAEHKIIIADILTGYFWHEQHPYGQCNHIWPHPHGFKVVQINLYQILTSKIIKNLVSMFPFSVTVYNLKEKIKESDLQNLRFFTEYGK